MISLEGANCADLPGFVIDKYFHCDASKQHLLAKAAKAICANCVVLDECRDQALTSPGLQGRGVVGGVTVGEIRRARAWLAYERGFSDNVPRGTRPDWLPTRSDGAEAAELARLELDPDERPFEA